MKFTVLSLFPEILEVYFRTSIMAKAVDRGLIQYELINFRDFAADKHRTCDDYPYGGGAGMVLKAEPVSAALESLDRTDARVIFPSPSGRLFTQDLARRLSREEHLIFLCGRYEGLDQRVIDAYIDEEICIGDYIISSGEIASLVLIDGVYRLLEGVISGESLVEESFEGGILEYPQYTRPEVFLDRRVPEVLLSGHHEKIRKWRLAAALEKTIKNRPELLENRNLQDPDLDKEIREILNSLGAPKKEG